MSFFLRDCNCKQNNNKMTTSLQTRPYSQDYLCFLFLKFFKAEILKKILKKKRMSLFTAYLNGSFTLETALILPIYFMVVANLIALILAMKLEGDVHHALHQIANEIAIATYVLDEKEDNQEEMEKKENTITEMGISLIATNVYGTQRLKEIIGRDKLNQSLIQEGSRGIQLIRSKIGDDDVIDLVATYYIEAPFSLYSYLPYKMVSRCRMRVWTGYDNFAKQQEEEYVYITTSKTIYHENPECKHLQLNIHTCSSETIATKRNLNGEIYTPCERCKPTAENTQLFYTDYGTVYHSKISCYSLKRNIQMINIKLIGSRSKCKECSKYK